MRLRLLILFCCILTSLIAEATTPTEALKIYNATELLNIGKKKGIHEIEKIVQPIDLVFLNPLYWATIIDIEFNTGFLEKLQNQKNIYTYGIPKNTMEVADNFINPKAGAKLFEYYCKLPKFIKSDTIYTVYNNLDDYLKLLIKYRSPKLIEKLKSDYYQWIKLAKKAPEKVYPTFEEMKKTSFEELSKFKPTDLYVDCNFLALQIAGALNSLKVTGFDDLLLEKLKKKQSRSFRNEYSFPKAFDFGPPPNYNPNKTVLNTVGIHSFKTDISKVYELLVKTGNIGWESKIDMVIEDGSKAYISTSRSNGYDFFRIEIMENKRIKIDLISSIIE